MPKLKRKFNLKKNQIFKFSKLFIRNMFTYIMPNMDPSEKIYTKSKPFYNKKSF